MAKLSDYGLPVAEMCPRCGRVLVRPKRVPANVGHLERRWCTHCLIWLDKGVAPADDADWDACRVAGAQRRPSATEEEGTAPVTVVRPNERLGLLRTLRRSGAVWTEWESILDQRDSDLIEAAMDGENEWLAEEGTLEDERARAKEWLHVARREAEAVGEIEVTWPGPQVRITDKGRETLRKAERATK